MFIKPKKKFWITGIAPYYKAVSGLTPATFTATDNPTPQNPAFAGTSVTFPNVSFGTANTNRLAVVGIYHDSATNPSFQISSVMIGGVTATKIVYDFSSASGVGMWYTALPTGTTATVVVNYPNNPGKVSIMAGAVVTTTAVPSDSKVKPGDTVADPQTMPSAMTVPTSGVGIVFAGDFPATFQTASWSSGTTNDLSVNDVAGTGIQLNLAHANSAGSWTPSVSGSSGSGFGFSGQAMVAAVWGQ